MTVEEALDSVLGRFCSSCGIPLPRPGEQCAGCGTLPEVTRAEMAERLATATARAQIAAGRLHAEAGELQELASGKLAEADRRLEAARLEDLRDEARIRADAAAAAAGELEAPERGARRARESAAADLDGAKDAYRKATGAHEAAVRLREGPEAERAALIGQDAGERVLQRYQAVADQAAAAHDVALQNLTAARGEAGRLEAGWRAAAVAAANPGRIPVSPQRIAKDLMRVAMSGTLDAVELAIARTLVAGLASVTGTDEQISREARRQLLREQEDTPAKPLILRALSGGALGAVANPANSGTPL
jgi:hypothetical protein